MQFQGKKYCRLQNENVHVIALASEKIKMQTGLKVDALAYWEKDGYLFFKT